MGKIKVTQCGDIEGLKVIEPTVFGDSRGYFHGNLQLQRFQGSRN